MIVKIKFKVSKIVLRIENRKKDLKKPEELDATR